MFCRAHILIVDDITDNIKIAMNILQEDNYEFSFATHWKETIELINQDNVLFDLILLDIMMPEIDGFALCKKIKQNPRYKDTPIIFLTAKVDIDSIRKGFSLGGVDYITKPFHSDEILARVKTHVQLHQAKVLLKTHNIALESKIEFEHQRLLSELEYNQKEMIWMLTELMESTSDETGKHIRRVAELSSLLAHLHPSLNGEDAETLFHASPMHDIGKMTIPHEILHKPGKYTEEEFNIMKAHTTNAYHLLSGSSRRLIKAAAIIAHEHHEKWDGSGYPRQLKGNQIHIYGRVVALADVFDALTHSRCYKDAWEMNQVIEYIQEHRATQFDPQLVDILIEHLDQFKTIAEIT